MYVPIHNMYSSPSKEKKTKKNFLFEKWLKLSLFLCSLVECGSKPHMPFQSFHCMQSSYVYILCIYMPMKMYKKVLLINKHLTHTHAFILSVILSVNLNKKQKKARKNIYSQFIPFGFVFFPYLRSK